MALLLGAVQFYRFYIRFSPSYSVSATFTVHMGNDTLSADGSISSYSFDYDKTMADQLAVVFPYVMQSNIVQERVCKDLGVPLMPAAVEVTCIAGTNMITITTTGTDAQMTYDVLLSVIDNYSYVTEYIIGPTKLVMISSPEVPTEPDNAVVWKEETAIGILIGLLLGAVWITLYAILRQTVRTKEELQQELNQTCVGILPQVTFKRYSQKINTDILLTNRLVGNDFMESLRLLKSAVQNNRRENEKVILITSTAPGEGKSVTTVNLAAMFAKNGSKVLVIDGDLRSSGISKMLFPNPSVQTVESNSTYDIVKVEEFGINVLRFRTSQKRLWRIMRSNELKRIIESVREQYDLIFIDTPPCGMISDATVVAGVADATLYVVRQDTVLTARIREGINTMLSTDARFMGCILNGTLGGLGGYGNYYGYGGYNHYYRYGYYGKRPKKKASKQ